jgi:hypothetical protein
MPIAASVHRTVDADLSAWRARFPWLEADLVHVFYEGDVENVTVQRAVTQFATWLVSECNVKEVVTAQDASLLRLPEWCQLHRRTPEGVLLQRFLAQDEEPYSPLARLSVLRRQDAKLLEKVCHVVRPFHIVMCHVESNDPENPKRLLRHTARHSALLIDVLETLAK